jgi:hypothetical protein
LFPEGLPTQTKKVKIFWQKTPKNSPKFPNKNKHKNFPQKIDLLCDNK